MTDARLAEVDRLERLKRWLANPQHATTLWLGQPCVIVAWFGLLVAVISPPHGFGISVCWFFGATGLPCLGCGVTRSLSCGLRGLWLESWQYHPMGLPILALFGLTVVQSLLPRPVRERLAQRLKDRAFWFNALYLAFVVVFVGFGVARALSRLGARHLLP